MHAKFPPERVFQGAQLSPLKRTPSTPFARHSLTRISDPPRYKPDVFLSAAGFHDPDLRVLRSGEAGFPSPAHLAAEPGGAHRVLPAGARHSCPHQGELGAGPGGAVRARGGGRLGRARGVWGGLGAGRAEGGLGERGESWVDAGQVLGAGRRGAGVGRGRGGWGKRSRRREGTGRAWSSHI